MSKRSLAIEMLVKRRAMGEEAKYKEQLKLLSKLSTELLILLLSDEQLEELTKACPSCQRASGDGTP